MSAEGMARSKVVHLVRHGQAQHNPRAEKARNAGCDTPTFLELMRQDDAFDAALTPTGLEQAAGASQHSIRGVELIVASSLSRAIDTADIIFPPGEQTATRVSRDEFREISGWLLNAKRRTRSELSGRNPSWDFSGLHSEEDGLWTPDLEGEAACAERAYLGLRWLWDRPEHHAAVVAHGGVWAFLLGAPGHPNVRAAPSMAARFRNCELRSCRLSLLSPGDGGEGRPVFAIDPVDAAEEDGAILNGVALDANAATV
mmetsp:Transcript_48204/g.114698  ORF Transcript_48204/g.114698 Transcript_48204/m.114698 type:complete len:257 (-) Transcript_48204:172-942(-)